METPHKKEVVFRSKDSIVFRCGSCERLHLEFGNFAVDFNEKEFHAFQQTLRQLVATPFCQCSPRNNYYIKFRGTPFQMGLTVQELQELRFLVETSILILETESGKTFSSLPFTKPLKRKS
jgi:hypothetical protein